VPTLVTAKNRRFKCMPFGEPASGKTTWACTAQDHPAMSPVLVLDSDDGLLSVAARGDIEAEECKTIEQYETILGKIATGDPTFKEFKTIITDSGSDLLVKALREEGAKNYAKSQTTERAKRDSKDELHMRDYGTVTNRMKRLFDIARGLPAHVIITSLAATHYPVIGKNQDGTDKLGPDPDSVHPAFTAKLGIGIRGLMDFVWYFYRTNDEAGTKFHILTQERGPFKAKTRGTNFPSALGEHVVGKSLPEVYDLLLASEGGPA
jgi:AAA domain-containing protein